MSAGANPIYLHLYIFTSMKQEFENVKLTLNSEEGIKPLMNYDGWGRLNTKNGFCFTERKKVTRVKNCRVAKLCEGTFIMHERKTGLFKVQIMLSESDMTQKGLLEKFRPMLEEAKEGGWI